MSDLYSHVVVTNNNLHTSIQKSIRSMLLISIQFVPFDFYFGCFCLSMNYDFPIRKNAMA